MRYKIKFLKGAKCYIIIDLSDFTHPGGVFETRKEAMAWVKAHS